MKKLLFIVMLTTVFYACKTSADLTGDDVYAKKDKTSKSTKDTSSVKKDLVPFDYEDHIVWTKASNSELYGLYLYSHSEIRLSCEKSIKTAKFGQGIERKEKVEFINKTIPAGTVGRVLDIKWDKFGPSEFYMYFDKQDVTYKLWFYRKNGRLFYLRDSEVTVNGTDHYSVRVTDKGEAYLDVSDKLTVSTSSKAGVANGGY